MKRKIQNLSILMILISTKSFSQDTIKINEIDKLVNSIKQSNFKIEKDTLKQDKPEYGLKMTTYLTIVTADNQLKKYENLVKVIMIQDGKAKEITTSSTFYYEQNKLIKVEEYMMEGNDKKTVDWYYSEGKPLFYTLKSEEADKRALLLITLSDNFLKQIIK